MGDPSRSDLGPGALLEEASPNPPKLVQKTLPGYYMKNTNYVCTVHSFVQVATHFSNRVLYIHDIKYASTISFDRGLVLS